MSEGVRRVLIGVLCAVAVGFAVVTQGFHHAFHDTSDAPRYERIDDAAEVEWDFVIPEGTAARIAAGEDVELVPDLIEAEVGETIRIENRDASGQTLGPWYVGAGETVTQRFASEGVYTGECNVHPSGQIRVEVTS